MDIILKVASPDIPGDIRLSEYQSHLQVAGSQATTYSQITRRNQTQRLLQPAQQDDSYQNIAEQG
jgi:hypothetical protein